MGEALVFGLIGSSALVIGVLLAFASGTLISALAFEHSRPLNSMATAGGFLVSFILSG